MLTFTKYAENKFDILNKYKVYLTREQIEDTVKLPDKTEKKGKYLFAEKEGIKVVLQKLNNQNKVITFYPTKD